MSSLTTEQLAVLTKLINDRLAEFNSVGAVALSRGVVRLAVDVYEEWAGDAPETDASEATSAFETGKEAGRKRGEYERGYSVGLAEILRPVVGEEKGKPDTVTDWPYQSVTVSPHGVVSVGASTGDIAPAPQTNAWREAGLNGSDPHDETDPATQMDYAEDDDPAELADAWPDMPDLKGGVDMFAEHPVAGEPDSEMPDHLPGDPTDDDIRVEKAAYIEAVKVLVGKDALSPSTAATLGPEHTSVTPLAAPVGPKRPLDPMDVVHDYSKPMRAHVANGFKGTLPAPDVAREKLATALAQGSDGALASAIASSPLRAINHPRTLAEVDADDDDDIEPAEEVKSLRMTPDEKAAQFREIIYALQDMAEDGVMPSINDWTANKPSHLPTWQTIRTRWAYIRAWGDLAMRAGLTYDPKRKGKKSN